MKLIVAIIRSERVDAVETALEQRNLSAVSISPVLINRGETGSMTNYRGATTCARQSKLRLEIPVNDQAVESAVQAIVRSGSAPDGIPADEVKVFVIPLETSGLGENTADDAQYAFDPEEESWDVDHEFAREGLKFDSPLFHVSARTR